MTVTDLFTSAIRLREGGLVRAEERRMSGADAAADTGWHVAAFHVETDADVHADHWEMHPESEEAVCVLAGGVRLFLRASGDDAVGEEEGPVVLGAGAAYIVPRGRWHRLEVDGPSDLMSIGLRAGTRLARRVEGMGAA
jgi:mannose-6-phosphate isomerase-like protein (cupin superfamily)